MFDRMNGNTKKESTLQIVSFISVELNIRAVGSSWLADGEKLKENAD